MIDTKPSGDGTGDGRCQKVRQAQTHAPGRRSGTDLAVAAAAAAAAAASVAAVLAPPLHPRLQGDDVEVAAAARRVKDGEFHPEKGGNKSLRKNLNVSGKVSVFSKMSPLLNILCFEEVFLKKNTN